uniref:TRAF3-interacting protein 1 N-terminal domain-containing protein n=1 Tax=Chromera velia CCMP2878 TaxID=1169474 RepID=A0A0G4GZY8_9ALVE|eukprot:Cvel_5455.t1-p1 / transcript=Cvel_5455.t1 / gene=Cvel_5455 / organism=Chromera_velia_CCMP2878 / gene_product=TRAF3-interacting protein 1, putative / transcript_product=TRAF3-interacting protein 1, putative / location=Cvel_scaffold255:13335-23532(+) / protein_length=426 / sequence_SO=supercontig / SO=protein_coding / is_pseudo=false
MALLSREWEGSLPFSTRVRLKRDLGEGGFEQLVKLLNEMTKGYAEAARFHREVLLPKLKDYFEKNKASAYVLNTATELAASSESTMIAPLFLFELLSRLDLSLMVKSALEITEKNFNREEFSVPQVAILYGGDAAGRDFTLSAIEKQTPILVLQASSFTDKKAILTVTTKIVEVMEPPTTPSDFVDIIKNITQLEAAFSEEVIIQVNQNFMETLIRVKGTAEEDSLTVGAGRQTIGQLVSKPKMVDKYLKRPPFRFLHNTISEVLRVTKYALGLFTEQEMDCGNLKDEATKGIYLQKIVDCVSLELGKNVKVSTSKIVAGLEPANTSAFLVQLHKAATTSKDGGAATVQRVHAGENVLRNETETPTALTAAATAPEKENRASMHRPPTRVEPAGPSTKELKEAERPDPTGLEDSPVAASHRAPKPK